MGITMMGNNFGGLTMPLVVGFVIGTASWEAAFAVIGVIAFVLAVVALLVIHERPSRASDSPRSAAEEQSGSKVVLTGFTVREALRTRSFYAMTTAMMLATFTYSTVLPQVSTHLSDNDIAPAVVVTAVSLLAAFGMAGKICFGFLAERITARRATMLSLAGQIVFISLIVARPAVPAIWITVPLFGFCMGAYGVLSPLIVQETFGMRYFGSISGLAGMFSVVSLVSGPLLAGASFDRTGSLGPAFIIVAVLFAIGILLFTQVRRPSLDAQTPIPVNNERRRRCS